MMLHFVQMHLPGTAERGGERERERERGEGRGERGRKRERERERKRDGRSKRQGVS